jgi:hypothetical protein
VVRATTSRVTENDRSPISFHSSLATRRYDVLYEETEYALGEFLESFRDLCDHYFSLRTHLAWVLECPDAPYVQFYISPYGLILSEVKSNLHDDADLLSPGDEDALRALGFFDPTDAVFPNWWRLMPHPDSLVYLPGRISRVMTEVFRQPPFAHVTSRVAELTLGPSDNFENLLLRHRNYQLSASDLDSLISWKKDLGHDELVASWLDPR